ncbi:Acireductone dioxygenase [Metschnikowia bicuspidata var. bicuspidata NRRL YB-4993]|uniref:Acireductone dioxygenase n=1 Tax=Metschnikowia bicuspidata var. bicuspidata NRRL YB-4993 TaxID=869754 RepID=A0A1A0H7B2_9ASCO|nr:Acireductone dioxygenase [Metschnikowia bicuspidata var. bicuspidata NRRL YB-4993]OBA19984.1 Acireductone dioxygenase [Metschnikowia bicuspidata var. bicuspidata NRRL YB-4993]
MVSFFYHDGLDTSENFTEEHHSGKFVTEEKLAELGVVYKYIDNLEDLEILAQERDYKNRDVVNLNLGSFGGDETAYNNKMRQFYTEHYHEDEEIRYVQEGEGYFDVRDKEDKWIRAKLEKNDLLILPAGIYHRFTLLSKLKNVTAMRLFKDEPKWEAINRVEQRETKARSEYAQSISGN